MAEKRIVSLSRKTAETDIALTINLDGVGEYEVDTGIPFFDHMLCLFAKHGLFDLNLKAIGDLDVDYHHTVEDVGIAVGQAFKEALGDKKGIRRFAEANVPLNEALAQCIIDISGRAFFVFNLELPKAKLGEFDVELVPEFFQAFAANSDITLHFSSPYWNNLHHITEALFKSFSRALDSACTLDSRSEDVPSTKGTL